MSPSPSQSVDPATLADDQRVAFACEQTNAAVEAVRKTELPILQRKRGALQGLEAARLALLTGSPPESSQSFLLALAGAGSGVSLSPDGDPQGLILLYESFCPEN